MNRKLQTSKRSKNLSNTKKRNIIIISSILIYVIVAIFLIPFDNQDRKSQRFFEKEMKEGICFSEIRLNELKSKGSETFIEGNIFLRLDVSQKPEPIYIVIEDSKHRIGRYKIEGKYQPEFSAYEGNRDIPLYPDKGSALDFPFDDMEFDFSIKVQSGRLREIKFKKIDFYQNLSGFFLNNPPECNSMNKTMNIKFNLKRKLYSKALFSVLAFFSLIYLLIILIWVKNYQPLITSIVTFFVSVWALGTTVNTFKKGVTSRVDDLILFLSITLLYFFLTKLIIKKWNS